MIVHEAIGLAYSFLGVFYPLQCATDWACWISLVLAVGKGFTSSGSSVKYLWHHDLTHVFRIALRHETWVAYNIAGPVAVLIVFFSVLVLWIGPFWGSVSRTRRGSHGLTWTPCSDLQGIWSPLLGLVGLAIGIRPILLEPLAPPPHGWGGTRTDLSSPTGVRGPRGGGARV